MTKTRSLLLSTAALGALCMIFSPAAVASVIDINRSVAENGLTPDLLYWNFDGNALDSSPNQINGTLDKGSWGVMPTYVEGKFGEAVKLEGYGNINHRHPNVNWAGSGSPDDTKLDFYQTSFTGGAWVKYDEIRFGVVQTSHILERGQMVAYGTGYNFFSLRLLKDAADQWSLSFSIGDPAKGHHTVNSTLTSGALNDMDWHHIGFSFEYNPDGDNLITFFLDGEQLGDVRTESYDFVRTSTANERKFTVGERGTSNYLSDFNGRIDDVFLTTGAHRFQAIPEPGSVALAGVVLLAFSGLRLVTARTKR